MKPNAQLKPLFQLIKAATTIKVAQEFLKEKNLPSSASTWQELFDKRIVPPMDVGTLTLAHLYSFLRQVEEFGRQHIFLFECDPERAVKMLAKQRIQDVTKEQELDHLLTAPLAVELPAQPEVVDLRWGTCAHAGKLNATFLVKVVETRTHYELAGETMNANGSITKQLSPVKSRGVNTARLHADGTLEVRLASHRNGTQYKESLQTMFAKMSPWFPKDAFTPKSVTAAKNAIYTGHAALKAKIRHGTQTLTNDNGISLTARTASPSDDVFGDQAAEQSLEKFYQSDTYCASSAVFFKLGTIAAPRELQVNLTGEENEFFIPLGCTEDDYEYVFEQVRTLNS